MFGCCWDANQSLQTEDSVRAKYQILGDAWQICGSMCDKMATS